MKSEDLLKAVLEELDNLKAIQVSPLDVKEMTCITDHMVIASGTSTRHVLSIAENLRKALKAKGVQGTCEGDKDGDWMLVDLGDVVVHIMHPRTRDFYNLEKLWSAADASLAASSNSSATA